MPAVPANFLSRAELQGLVCRADELLTLVGDAELAFGLRQLLRGAAYLDGVLADMAPGTSSADEVLRDPNGWSSEWQEGSFALHTRRGLFRVSRSQQFLRHPAGGRSVATGRFRLVLGDGPDRKVFVSGDCRHLRGVLMAYLSRFRDSLPASVLDGCLRFFPSEDAVDAVSERGTEAVDVGERPGDGSSLGRAHA